MSTFDWAGLAAVIAAASAFVTAVAAAFIKVVHELHEIKAQNVRIEDHQDLIHNEVNSKLTTALNKVETLHGENAILREDKQQLLGIIPPALQPQE